MNHGTATHLKYMLYVAAGLFVVLTIAGVPLSTALTYGVFLACPLMMVWMLIAMGGHGHGGGSHDDHAAATGRRDAADLDRR
jgi:peptidoglycan/LPS O-acetylase OafA/YrhL